MQGHGLREYVKVTPRLWTGELGKALRGDVASQALAAYLISCPHGNMIGLFRLPLSYIAADLGWQLRAVRKSIERLRELGFVEYNEGTERLWVVEAWRIELCKPDLQPGDNRRAEVAKLLRPNLLCPLTARFLSRYPETRAALEGVVEGLPEPLPSPSEAPPEGVARDTRVTSEQEQEQRIPPVSPPAGRGGTAGAGAGLIPAEMEWRVRQTWDAHLEAWRRFCREENGGRDPGGPPPTLTAKIRRAILDALKVYDRSLLGAHQRVEWGKQSKVRGAGIGIFLSRWHTGQDPKNDRRSGGRTYLEHWRPWVIQRGKDSKVEEFAALYFKRKQQ